MEKDETTTSIQAETKEESIQLGREIADLDIDLIALVIGGIKSKFAERGIELVVEGKNEATYESFGPEETAFARLSNSIQVHEITLIAEALALTQTRMDHYMLTKGLVYEQQEAAGYVAPEPKPFSIADLLKDFLEGDCDNQSCPIHHPQNQDEN